MANSGHDLPLIVERANELQRSLVDAQDIRIDLPARQDNGVVVFGARAAEGYVDFHGPTPVLQLPAADFAGFWGDDIHRGAVLLETVAWDLELRLLEAVCCKDGNLLARKTHRDLLLIQHADV